MLNINIALHRDFFRVNYYGLRLTVPKQIIIFKIWLTTLSLPELA